MSVELETLEPPERPDFRRIGRQKVPVVNDPITGRPVRYRRTSSAGKILDDDSGLWDWKLRTQLVGAAMRPELMALVSTLDAELDKKRIRDISEDCLVAGKGEARQIQGSAVHSMFDHVDLGHNWQPAPQFRSTVDAYLEVLEAYGLEPIDVEVHCVNDRYRLAGTLDRRYRTKRALTAPDGTIIPIGSVLVGDTKTGLRLEYAAGTYVTQLAGYVDSVRYDVRADCRIVFDPPNYPLWAVVVHAVPETETVALYWVDLEAGREGLQLASQVWDWRRKSDLLIPAKPPLRIVAVEAPERPQEAPEGEALPGTAQPSQEALKAFLRARVLAVKDHSDVAMRELQRVWPKDMPGLKAEGQTEDQLLELSDRLASIEQQWAIQYRPFLLMHWLTELGRDSPLIEPLRLLANLDAAKWDDNSLDLMLRGTLRSLGYESLADLPDREISNMLGAVFAITSGTAMLMYDEYDRPVVRFNVKEAR